MLIADNDSRLEIGVAGFELSLQIRWQEEFVSGFWMLDRGFDVNPLAVSQSISRMCLLVLVLRRDAEKIF